MNSATEFKWVVIVAGVILVLLIISAVVIVNLRLQVARLVDTVNNHIELIHNLEAQIDQLRASVSQ